MSAARDETIDDAARLEAQGRLRGLHEAGKLDDIQWEQRQQLLRGARTTVELERVFDDVAQPSGWPTLPPPGAERFPHQELSLCDEPDPPVEVEKAGKKKGKTRRKPTGWRRTAMKWVQFLLVVTFPVALLLGLLTSVSLLRAMMVAIGIVALASASMLFIDDKND